MFQYKGRRIFYGVLFPFRCAYRCPLTRAALPLPPPGAFGGPVNGSQRRGILRASVVRASTQSAPGRPEEGDARQYFLLSLVAPELPVVFQLWEPAKSFSWCYFFEFFKPLKIASTSISARASSYISSTTPEGSFRTRASNSARDIFSFFQMRCCSYCLRVMRKQAQGLSMLKIFLRDFGILSFPFVHHLNPEAAFFYSRQPRNARLLASACLVSPQIHHLSQDGTSSITSLQLRNKPAIGLKAILACSWSITHLVRYYRFVQHVSPALKKYFTPKK